MTSLHDLGLHFGTDKATNHGYCHFYEEILQPYRKHPVALLEIGVAGGESMKMWSEYFYHKDSRIYGVEIQNKPLPEFNSKVKVFITDACSPNAVYDITNEAGKLDVWIDDGSHYVRDQKSALELWWPHIKPGGIAIIEDTHSNYSYPWLDAGETPFVHSLGKYIDMVNENGKDQCGKPTDSPIEEIIFRKSLVVIKKQ